MKAPPVLVFDSGIGGLSVLRELRIVLPGYPFVFVADDAGFPYGEWDEGPLSERILALFDRLLAEYKPVLVVVACNTASTLVLKTLRAHFADMPFVGTVPAIKPAAERTRSGLVSVLATPGTVRRAYTRDLIDSYASRCHVRLVGSEVLAQMAERYVQGKPVDDECIRDEIAPCFVERNGQRTDIVVLACTHYPFLANAFRRLAPWPVDWLDPAEAIARRTASIAASLVQHRDDGQNAGTAVFTSNRPGMAIRSLVGSFGLKYREASPEISTLSHRIRR